MTITRSDELHHSPAARDTKSSSRVIAIIIRLLNNILFSTLRLYERYYKTNLGFETN
jgi:hypothetical protein